MTVLGLIKKKGDALSTSPERFVQFEVKYYVPWELLKREMIGYCIFRGVYWLIIREGEGRYIRTPFAKSALWFRAITSEPEFAAIGNLPQIFITGVA